MELVFLLLTYIIRMHDRMSLYFMSHYNKMYRFQCDILAIKACGLCYGYKVTLVIS